MKTRLLSDPEIVKATEITKGNRTCYLNAIISVTDARRTCNFNHSYADLLIETFCTHFNIKKLVPNWEQLMRSHIKDPEFNWDYMHSIMHKFLIKQGFKVINSKVFSFKQLSSESVIFGPSPIIGAKHYFSGDKLASLLSMALRYNYKRNELIIYIRPEVDA